MVDGISFEIMRDPVITPQGRSYDRTSILQHLAKSEYDPLTREPLKQEWLLKNLNLREGCEEFLENNGWAADW